MDQKRKQMQDLIPKHTRDSFKRFADDFVFVISITAVAIAVAILVSTLLHSTSHKSPYRFCLATESEETCVYRPGIIIGDKISKKPDKLLDYFGSIPARVQDQWRVWVMDVEKSETVEMTVAEFYDWIDSVWHPLQAGESVRQIAPSTPASG